MRNWFQIEDASRISTPALLVYRQRVRENVQRMVRMAGSPDRLWPHVKTHKMSKVCEEYQRAGLSHFKCSTIAEAEMLAKCSAEYVLVALQPVGPNPQRLATLAKQHPHVRFATIVDHLSPAVELSKQFAGQGQKLDTYLDIDVGMGRTGIAPGAAAVELFQELTQLPGVRPVGLHVYDGHIRDASLDVRKTRVAEAFEDIESLTRDIRRGTGITPKLVAGGTPTFPVHCQYEDRVCSPGTCVFWDFGYEEALPDLDFEFAAVLLTRVLSRIGERRFCVDLGHKAVASESPPPRVKFLNIDGITEVGHSEEHLVLEADADLNVQPGDVLYAVPRHICPTVALHQAAHVVDHSAVVDAWRVDARDRCISV